jgi:hypothetical protein
MIKVKWVKAHFKYSYSAGDVGYVKADVVESLVAGGYVIPLPDEIKETVSAPAPAPIPDAPVVVNPLPEDLPGREKLFGAGFDSLEKIREAGDSLLDGGISNAMVKKIGKYLKDK